MRGLLGIGVVVLLIGAPLVGAAQEEEAETFPLTDDEREIASLKVDLINAAQLALQWKGEALVRDQRLLQQSGQLLQQENVAWTAWRDDLQVELDALFDCAYDMEEKACAPASAAVQEPSL